MTIINLAVPAANAREQFAHKYRRGICNPVARQLREGILGARLRVLGRELAQRTDLQRAGGS